MWEEIPIDETSPSNVGSLVSTIGIIRSSAYITLIVVTVCLTADIVRACLK